MQADDDMNVLRQNPAEVGSPAAPEGSGTRQGPGKGRWTAETRPTPGTFQQADVSLNDMQERKLAGMLVFYRPLFLRAYGGHAPKSAIKAFCLECVGYQRAEITHCTARGCPLYPYRPYQSADAGDEIEGDEA